jgi:hypothetical protein
MKRSGWLLALGLAMLMATLAARPLLIAAPQLRAEVDEGRFDARRAFDRLTRILGDQSPHPADSAANDAVRERLIAEMGAVGLEPRTSDDFACNSFVHNRVVNCARVVNIWATIGPDEGRHMLAVAHYDSALSGPGATDAGIGVATLLESAHLLRDRALERPVTFLLTDGEESGLIGARAFLERNPLAEQVEAAVNFEARGTEGPAIMFETSRPNAQAVHHFARSSGRPVANSLATDFYKMIPNSTDVAVFEERLWTILNFAVIGNETRYHSAGDNLAALSLRSLQHMGDQGSALIADLATAPTAVTTGERIYADLLGRYLVVLPAMLGLIILGLLLLLFAVHGWKRGGLGRSGIAFLAAVAGAAALAWLGQTTVGLFRAGDFWRAWPIASSIAVQFGALAATLFALRLLARDMKVERLRTAFWLFFLLLGTAVTLIAPGGAILFLLPTLPLAAAAFVPRAERIAAWASAFLLFLLLAPLLHLIEVLLFHGSAWIFAPLAVLILLPLLIELKPLVDGVGMRAVIAGGGVAAALAWLIVGLVPAYSEDRQQQFAIEYFLDSDSGVARWLVNNDGAPLPEGFEGFERGFEPHWSKRKRWSAPAPALALAAPAAELLGERRTHGGRRIRVRIAAGGAESVTLKVPTQAGAVAAGAPDFMRRFGQGSADDPFWLRCQGRSCDGAVFDLLLATQEPVELTLIGLHRGLPEEAAPFVAARPAHARPQYVIDGRYSVRRARF